MIIHDIGTVYGDLIWFRTVIRYPLAPSGSAYGISCTSVASQQLFVVRVMF